MGGTKHLHVSAGSLSADKSVLLAVHWASIGDVSSLQKLACARSDVLAREKVLQIILTYLPETTDAAQYMPFVGRLAHGNLPCADEQDAIETEAVEDVSPSKARSRVARLSLLPIQHPSFSAADFPDLLTQFLISRAHRIEQETGLVSALPALLNPFLDGCENLKTWFISTVLPLLRYQYEYYSELGLEQGWRLDQVELADDAFGPTLWLSHSLSSSNQTGTRSEGAQYHGKDRLVRDLRCLMGPWIYGSNARKRRRVDGGITVMADGVKPVTISNTVLDLTEPTTFTCTAWTAAYQELIRLSRTDLPLVADTISVWSGPTDIDLGGYSNAQISPELDQQYAQTCFAVIYAGESSDLSHLLSTWTVLVKISSMVGSEELDADVEAGLDKVSNLPNLEFDMKKFPKYLLDFTALLNQDHPLTQPTSQNYHFLKRLVLSTLLLAKFGQPVSVVGTATIKLFLDSNEQYVVFQKLLGNLSGKSKQSDIRWAALRSQLLWLWGWGSENGDGNTGRGVFGNIRREIVEKELLEALIHSKCYATATNIYITRGQRHLTVDETEQVIASTVLQYYDNASSGNNKKGDMKLASDILGSFAGHFPRSITFARLHALLRATHAMSSYSLTLEHGVPFKPVAIRISADPLLLIEKILAQNPGSYAKAQDLISIGTDLIAAGTGDLRGNSSTATEQQDLDVQQRIGQRRIISMAIEAALHENDFETAYSYVVNWLNDSRTDVVVPTSVPASAPAFTSSEDIAWRAALAAGKYKPPATGGSSAPSLRRLEQRMDLLSQSLLLAPAYTLPEILSAWRKCEEEMSALLAAQDTLDQEQDGWDAQTSQVPGAFELDLAAADAEATRNMQLARARRSPVAGATTAEEASMGLFDVARGAAAAFSKTTFPLRGAAAAAASAGSGTGAGLLTGQTRAGDESGEMSGDGGERVRRRDVVANAVTGGLASGIGWVLGATPHQQAK